MGPLGRNSLSLRAFAEKRARSRAEQGLANHTPPPGPLIRRAILQLRAFLKTGLH